MPASARELHSCKDQMSAYQSTAWDLGTPAVEGGSDPECTAETLVEMRKLYQCLGALPTSIKSESGMRKREGLGLLKRPSAKGLRTALTTLVTVGLGQPCPLLDNRGTAGRAEDGEGLLGCEAGEEEGRGQNKGRRQKGVSGENWRNSWRREEGERRRADGREGEGAGWGLP